MRKQCKHCHVENTVHFPFFLLSYSILENGVLTSFESILRCCIPFRMLEQHTVAFLVLSKLVN